MGKQSKTFLLTVLMLSCFPFLTFAQEKSLITICGTVIDDESKEPLIGASVMYSNRYGVCTDIDGKFTLQISDMDDSLVVSYVSYETVKCKVEKNMVITLHEVKGVTPRKERVNIQLTEGDKEVISGINSLAFRLFNAFDNQKSIMISPLSIACLLSMTGNGAAGDTQKEINKVLNCTPKTANTFYKKMIPFLTDSQYGSKFNMANALFVDPSFRLKKAFLQEADSSYQALVSQSMDIDEVNGWCARQTNGMIPSILDKQSAGSSLTALNAVYFESLWEKEFDIEDTEDEKFTKEDGTKKTLPMMHQEKWHLYYKGKNFAVMEKPYKGEIDYRITFILPDKGHTLHQVLGQFDEKKWQEVCSRKRGYIVDVKLPRFKTESDLELIPVMRQLGIQSAFDGGRADFSKLTYMSPVSIEEMKQKSAIEVNEKGTKAAVVTVEIITVGYAGSGRKPEYCNFHATRPFAYVISEAKTGTIVFMGAYYGE